jgi:hypothetical protein
MAYRGIGNTPHNLTRGSRMFTSPLNIREKWHLICDGTWFPAAALELVSASGEPLALAFSFTNMVI